MDALHVDACHIWTRQKRWAEEQKKEKKIFRVDLDAASWTRKGGHHHHHAPIERGIYNPRPFQTLFSSSFLLMNNDVMVSCCSCCSCHATLVSTSLTRWQSGVSPLLFDDQKEEENLRHWNSRWKEKEKKKT